MSADLPKCVYFKNGAYYLVKQNRWIRLGDERKASIAAANALFASYDAAHEAQEGLDII